MSRIIQLETPRLRLRQWQADDFSAFAKLNADPLVMRYFPHCLNKNESDQFALRLQTQIQNTGWGLWAIEAKSSQQFLGYTGLQATDSDYDFSPTLEIGWRLAREYWHQGFATEAAEQVLQFAFKTLQLDKVVSITAAENKASIALMKRLRMLHIKDFKHPGFAPSHALSAHVLYQLTLEQWSNSALNIR